MLNPARVTTAATTAYKATAIITPTSKAFDCGHDEPLTASEIISQGLLTKAQWDEVSDKALKLFAFGQKLAAERGLILVDTKYEFGKHNGTIYLMDEIHTPDSSRYFYAEGYEERFEKGEEQKQLSKEFVRQWLIANGFQGKTGQQVPLMTPEYCDSVSERYIELYENIVGEEFQKADTDNLVSRIEKNVMSYLQSK